MGHRRESVYHEDLVGFLRGERWEQQDIEELEAHAHEGIGVSDQKLEDLTRFILLKAEEVAAREQADAVFMPQVPAIEATTAAQQHFEQRFREVR